MRPFVLTLMLALGMALGLSACGSDGGYVEDCICDDFGCDCYVYEDDYYYDDYYYYQGENRTDEAF